MLTTIDGKIISIILLIRWTDLEYYQTYKYSQAIISKLQHLETIGSNIIIGLGTPSCGVPDDKSVYKDISRFKCVCHGTVFVDRKNVMGSATEAGWPDCLIIFSLFGRLQKWNFSQRHDIFGQSRFIILPSNKYPLICSPKNFKVLPKWRNFAKSGHTAPKFNF